MAQNEMNSLNDAMQEAATLVEAELSRLLKLDKPEKADESEDIQQDPPA